MTTKVNYQVGVKHVVVLLDRSGSMSSNWPATLESINGFIDDLKGEQASLSLVAFDSYAFEIVFKDHFMETSAPEHITEQTIHPRGGTPLNDAVGRTIRVMETQLDGRKQEVLFSIMTDGMENASKAYSTHEIKQLIEKKQADGWVFTYLGANQDAWMVAQSMGIPEGNAATYSNTEGSVRNLRLARSEAAAQFMRTNHHDSSRSELLGMRTNSSGVLFGDDLDI